MNKRSAAITVETADTDLAVTHAHSGRFYRPELDALRLLAFACVLVHHGAGRSGAFEVVRRAGGFGLSLFFVLSAYLITQLLLRERAEFGTIRLSSFYVRRILRIWPLYYSALVVCILIGRIPPHLFAINHRAIAGFAFFIINWQPRTEQVGLFAAMWSISIEEQFYLIWPLIAKLGGKVLVVVFSAIFIAGSVVTLALYSSLTWMLWYSTLVEFLFFGTGALLAVIVVGNSWSINPVWRLVLFGTGIAAWGVGSGIGGVGSDRVPGLTLSRLYIGFGAADAGCVLIFLAFLGARRLPAPIIYLGKISYGLYAFHLGMIRLSNWLLGGILSAPNWSILHVAAVDALAFLCCIGLATLSYQFFEKPFLRLKQRFELVRSRTLE